MSNNIIKRTWKQGGLVNIEDLRGSAFQAEDGGHTFLISGLDENGDTLALSGTPAGVLLRADGQDVTLTCSVSEGVVSATLPASAYVVPGRVGITIFLTSEGQKTAIYAAVGSVATTSSGIVAPPAGSDVVDLVNAIATAVATIPASYTDLMAAVAPTYSTSALYAVGSYAWYSGKLYRCTTAITSGETWTSAHWTQANLGSDVSDLKSAVNILNQKYNTWTYDLTSESYTTEITPIYAKIGDIFDIEVTQNSNANIAVYGDSYNLPFSSVGNYVFTAQADGYLRFYYKIVHCKIKSRNNVITSELGNSTELVASQKLANIVNGNVNAVKNDLDALTSDFDKAVGYKTAALVNGHYFVGTTVGGTVKLSGATTGWDYSAVPVFVKKGQTIHCTTRANGMCCIAKSNTATWTDNVPVAVAIADDNTNAKEYTATALADAYYWFSGRTGETSAYIENNSDGLAIIVDVNGNGNYSSFTACLAALQGNTEPKTIYIKEGTYDIFTELGGAEYIASITDPTAVNWRDVQPVVPRNTKIIGQGNVKMTFLPDASVIGSNNMAFLFSPLNIDSNCEVENIAIECTNCRYALHIESSSISAYNDDVIKIKNVRCKKTAGTYGTQYVCATGIGARQRWEFESCSFEGDLDIMWSVHVNVSVQNDMATVIMNNCVFLCTASNPGTKNAIRFVSSNNQSVKQNIAKLNNCYTNGKVFLENNNTKQQWDVTLLGCTYAGTGQSEQIVDNPYPIKEY